MSKHSEQSEIRGIAITDSEVITRVQAMAEESLSPEVFEMWGTVMHDLAVTRSCTECLESDEEAL